MPGWHLISISLAAMPGKTMGPCPSDKEQGPALV